MQIDNLIRILAGSMTLLSVALVWFVSPWWLLLTCFVGVNLIQSAFTGFCPPTLLLKKLGWLDSEGFVCRPPGTPGKGLPAKTRALGRIAVFTLLGAVAGGAFGYYRSCTSGTCPLGRHLWLGPLLGALLGLGSALAFRRPQPQNSPTPPLS